MRLSKVPVRLYFRGLKPVWALLAITVTLNLFLTPGAEPYLFQWGFLKISAAGLELSWKMALRLILMILGSCALTYTTSPILLTDGLESLFRPLSRVGFPAHEFAMMMSISLRFIPTLIEETDKIMKAQKARGADFETGGLLRRAKAMVPMLAPLFVSAFRRADELALAMESRCYNGGKGRTKFRQSRFGKIDLAAALIFAAFLAVMVLLYVYGGELL
jgi:energy-coupling factor transport system permease protein